VPALKHAALPVAAAIALSVLPGCTRKASPSQCDQLLDRYASLVVTEKFPDASAGQITAAQQDVKTEARGDDSFKNCSSQVSASEFDCAMRAPTPDAFEKCLE
jgi:hypothetical protein